MKKFLLIISVCFFTSSLFAQQLKHSVLYNMVTEKIRLGNKLINAGLFSQLNRQSVQGDSIVKHFVKLVLNRDAVTNMYKTKPEILSVNIPFDNKQYLLKLSQQPINTGDFNFGIVENNIRKKVQGDVGLNYRGYVDGDPSSFACISIFGNGEVMGVFSSDEGDFNIGKINNGKGDYVVYNSRDMVHPPHTLCATSEIPVGGVIKNPKNVMPAINASVPDPFSAPPLLCNKVRMYWEADNHLYVNNFGSNLTNTENYITGLFNVFSSIYQNEGIQVELSASYIWTTPDSYSSSGSVAGLTSFQSYWNGMGNSYKGDLAHLLAGGPSNNGGIAYLLDNAQCNRSYAFAYSNVYANYQAYPAYSWDAFVTSHETGHNLGSHHTHWCGWNTGPLGACGSIDNCYAQEAGDTCTTCPATTDLNQPHAGFKGTIMSYCHLVSGVGVNLANGFGPLPQAVIRTNVNNASCLRQGNSWTGAVNNQWENTGNWSCGSLPTATTDVTIGPGLPNYPVVKSAAICRSITQTGSGSVTVTSGFTLQIAGTDN